MTKLYLLFVIILFAYKIGMYLGFKYLTYSKEKDNVAEDLAKWRFNFSDIIYYSAIIYAVIYPLMNYDIELKLFLIGTGMILLSAGLYIYSAKNKITKYALLIDMFFIIGLGFQTNSAMIAILGFVHFGLQILIMVLKSKIK